MKTPLMRTQVLDGPDGASTSPEIPHHKPGMFALLFVGARRIKQLTSFREKGPLSQVSHQDPRSASDAGLMHESTTHNNPQHNGDSPKDPPDFDFGNGQMDLVEVYETWVDLGEKTQKARAELESLLAVRDEASRLTKSAQQVFDEGQEFRNKAQQLRDAARETLHRLLAVSPPDFAARVAALREFDENKQTQTSYQQAIQTETWEACDRARLRASGEVLKALHAVMITKSWVEREMEEATNLSNVAQSFKVLSRDELSSARAIVKELFLDLQEARDLPGVTQLLELATEKGVIEPQSPEGALESQPQRVVSDRKHRQTSSHGEVPSTYETRYTRNLFQKSAGLIKGLAFLRGDNEPSGTPEEWAGGVHGTKTQDQTFERRPSHSIDKGGPSIGEAAQTRNGADTGPHREPTEPEPAQEITEEGLKSELAGLRRSLQNVRTSIPTKITRQATKAASSAPPDEIDLPEQPASVAEPADLASEADAEELPAVESTFPDLEDELPPQPEDLPAIDALPQDSGEKLLPQVAETYTGTLTLVFTPSPDGEMLRQIWDVLDQEAGVGAVIDAEPLPGEAGYEFTLDLGIDVLVIDNLMSGIPRAELTAIDDAKLSINLSPA